MPNPLQADPSRTGLLRKALMREFARRMTIIERELVKLIVEEDAFGIKAGQPSVGDMYRAYNNDTLVANERWRFLTSTQKVAAFGRWLKGKFAQYVLQETVQEAEDRYWRAYVQEGYEKGAGRAYDAARKAGLASTEAAVEQHRGGKREFMRLAISAPETVEKTKLLASRVLTDLEGVGQSLATKMSRVLTDGLVQGQNPRTIARTLVGELGVEKRRAETIARTEIIRAHAEGQLDALERLGVTEVGVAVEWSTAGDDRVCPLCRPLDGVVFKTKEAHSLLPRHPNCRCAFLPANVGESSADQIKTKARIEAAIRESVRKEHGKNTKLSPQEQLARSKWLGAETKPDKTRPSTGIKPQDGQIPPHLQPGDTQSLPKEVIERSSKEEQKQLLAWADERSRLNKKLKAGTITESEKERLEFVKGAFATKRAEIRAREGIVPVPKPKEVKPKLVKPAPTPNPVTPTPTIQPTTAEPALPAASTPTPVVPDTGPSLPEDYKYWRIENRIEAHEDINEIHKKFLVHREYASKRTKLVRAISDKQGSMEAVNRSNRSWLRQHKAGLIDDAQLKEHINHNAEIMDKLTKDEAELAAKLEAMPRTTDEQLHEAMQLPIDARLKMSIKGRGRSLRPAAAQKAKKAQDFLSSITAKRSEKIATEVELAEMGKKTRGFYRDSENTMFIAEDDNTSTYIHEAAHHLEYQVPGLQGLANEFLAMRTSGTKSIPMKSLPGGYNYRDDEYGNPDDFTKAFGSKVTAAYVGKSYAGGATEVMSMGVELLYNNPGKLAAEDPQFFKFLIGALRGKL